MSWTRRAVAVGAAAALFTGLSAGGAAAGQKSTADVVRKAMASAPERALTAQGHVKTKIDPKTKKASVEFAPHTDVSVTPVDTANSVSLAQPDGVQVLTVLRKGDTARYKLDVPQEFSVTPSGEGLTIDADGPEGKIQMGEVQAPWAVDANGTSLPTRYVLRGTMLVQTVDTAGAQYPITLDPYIVRKWYGVQVRFSVGETRWMAVSSGAVAYLSQWIPPPYGRAVAAVSGAVTLWAGAALTWNNCIALNVTYWGGVYPWYWKC